MSYQLLNILKIGLAYKRLYNFNNFQRGLIEKQVLFQLANRGVSQQRSEVDIQNVEYPLKYFYGRTISSF